MVVCAKYVCTVYGDTPSGNADSARYQRTVGGTTYNQDGSRGFFASVYANDSRHLGGTALAVCVFYGATI